MMRGDLDGGGLVIEELVAEVARNAEFGETGARFLRKMVGHLDVDVVRREQLLLAPSSAR